MMLTGSPLGSSPENDPRQHSSRRVWRYHPGFRWALVVFRKAASGRDLWVCDGSVFPTTGGVNPSLTITSIALRTADRIRALASRGEL